MKKSRFREVQTVSILNEVESGLKVDKVCRKQGIIAGTNHKWRAKYGGMGASELKRRYADLATSLKTRLSPWAKYAGPSD